MNNLEIVNTYAWLSNEEICDRVQMCLLELICLLSGDRSDQVRPVRYLVLRKTYCIRMESQEFDKSDRIERLRRSVQKQVDGEQNVYRWLKVLDK